MLQVTGWGTSIGTATMAAAPGTVQEDCPQPGYSGPLPSTTPSGEPSCRPTSPAHPQAACQGDSPTTFILRVVTGVPSPKPDVAAHGLDVAELIMEPVAPGQPLTSADRAVG